MPCFILKVRFPAIYPPKLWNSPSQSKLSSLNVLYIEQNALDKNYNEVIGNFDALKTRKKLNFIPIYILF